MAPAAAVKDPFNGAVIAFIFIVIMFEVVVFVIGRAHDVIGRLISDKKSPVLLFAIALVPLSRLLPLLSVDFVLRV
jgi:hypothetical protein